jgi:hypothetical protein
MKGLPARQGSRKKGARPLFLGFFGILISRQVMPVTIPPSPWTASKNTGRRDCGLLLGIAGAYFLWQVRQRKDPTMVARRKGAVVPADP